MWSRLEGLNTHRPRWLALEVSFLSVWVLGFLAIYVCRFGAPLEAVAPHVRLLLNVWLGLFAVRLLLHRACVRSAAVGWLVSLLCVGVWSTVFVYHALVLVGLESWGRVITLKLIETYASQWSDLLGALGLRPWVVMALLGGGALLLLVLVWLG